VVDGPVPSGDIGNGPYLGTQYWPTQQIKSGTTGYGNFITGVATSNNNNWNPVSATADQLWRSGRFGPNDPCARYRVNGMYTDLTSNEEPGTAWRLPSISDWGEIYKGGGISGTVATATANTWFWNSSRGKGIEIRPDGKTTTLFLPANGYRPAGGSLYYQGTAGSYWSTTTSGVNASALVFNGYNVTLSFYTRATASGIRCVKHQ
jgi:hypothetical protein